MKCNAIALCISAVYLRCVSPLCISAGLKTVMPATRCRWIGCGIYEYSSYRG